LNSCVTFYSGEFTNLDGTGIQYRFLMLLLLLKIIKISIKTKHKF